MLSSYYRRLICCHLIMAFGLSLAFYDVVLFVVLLQRFICVGAIQKAKQI